MSSFIRASKYRHVYVEPPKVDQTYKGFRLATVTGEQQYIKANTTFFAVALQGGGGPFAVVKHKDVGEYKAGTPLVAGLCVTAFSDAEEAAVGQTDNVPFLLEAKFKALGGLYQPGADWHANVAVAGKLVTGQNPQSSDACAAAVVKLLAP